MLIIIVQNMMYLFVILQNVKFIIIVSNAFKR